MANTAVQPEESLYSFPPSFSPLKWQGSIFSEVWEDGRIFRWILNTMVITLGTVLLNLCCATPAAYAIAKTRFRGRLGMLFLVLFTQMIPPPLIIVPLYFIFKEVHLIDTYLCLILADTILTMPLSTWILTGFFEKLPHELTEAARLDGCSNYGIFMRIALPLTMPALVTVAILTFFDTWNEFIFAVTFIVSEDNWVGSIGLSSFIGQFSLSWRAMMAHSLVFAILPLGVYLLFRNFIVRGIAEGF
jgi:multiple sugar transport system permease protein